MFTWLYGGEVIGGDRYGRAEDRARLLAGVATLSEVIGDVEELLRRLADLLVPDFADMMLAAGADRGAGVVTIARPDDSQTRRVLGGVLARAGVPVSMEPRLWPDDVSGLSVIVVPAPDLRQEAAGRVVAFARHAERSLFDADDLAFVQHLVQRVSRRQPTAMSAPATASGRASRLQRLTARLSEALTPVQVADVVAEYAAAALGASAAWVGLVEPEGTGVEMISARGFDARRHPDFARVPVSADRPIAAAVRSGSPGWFTSRDEAWETFPLTGEQPEMGAMAVLPLSVAGQVRGVAALWRAQAGMFSPELRAEVLAMTTLGAQTLERALQYASARRVAGELQASLLPETPKIPGLRLWLRYLPAAKEVQVGGDWYDIMPLDSDRIGIVIGDVAGHGVHAATVMGQLRASLRAYLYEGHDPGVALTRTDQLTAALTPVLMTTVWCGVLNTATGALVYANAGHPLPVVAGAGGTVVFLNGSDNPPVGVGWGGSYSQAQVQLDPAALLVCYTDGLIERRGEHIDTGMQRLADLLREPPHGVVDIGERLLGLPLPRHVDDVAVLVVGRESEPVFAE